MMENPFIEKPYIFGTHEAELQRLGIQHRVWRPHVTEAWRRAGFTSGQTILDLGCGPGFLSLDLAEITGAAGKVIALDRSEEFLSYLDSEAERRGLQNISTHCINLDEDEIPEMELDGVYARWLFAFLRNPKSLLGRAIKRLRRGVTVVLHEYFHYHTFGFTSPTPAFDVFISAVLKAWYAEGGTPDIAPNLLMWCEEFGLTIESVRPIVHIVTPKSYIWQWPKSFVEVSPWRLADLGFMKKIQVEDLQREFAAIEGDGHTRIVTPAVLEIIARK
ncbi:MAG TPA: methyltransferase domain-containing protein [Candidatus Kapabacteria bacterium]|jgi:ubiquinone/menaquinone biosynthesis C-methylase UbiE|nr:methyltransferase domain-containing protein [Candidatus Kapabacteria bacterium]